MKKHERKSNLRGNYFEQNERKNDTKRYSESKSDLKLPLFDEMLG